MPLRPGHVPGAAPGGSATAAPLARHRRRHTPRPRSAPRGAPAHAGPSKPCPRAGRGGGGGQRLPEPLAPPRKTFRTEGLSRPPAGRHKTRAPFATAPLPVPLSGGRRQTRTHTDALFPERRGAQPWRGAEAVTCGLREDRLQSGNPRVHRAARPRGRGCHHPCHHNHGTSPGSGA